jgi:hypothetical protein
MRGQRSSQPKGCLQNFLYLLYVAVFGSLFAFSVFVAAPELEKHLELNVCQPGTIVEERKSRRELKTVICVDKKTGRKTNVSTYQFFQCCPPALVIFIAAICQLFLSHFWKANKD